MRLQDAIDFDREGLVRADPPPVVQRFVPTENQPIYNPMQRTPLPSNGSSTDAQRNFYQQGKMPQYRIAVPAAQAPTGNVSVTNNVSGSSSGSASTTIINSNTTTSSSNQDQTVGVVISSLDSGMQYQGSLAMAKSFLVKRITVDNAARVRLYSNALAQIIDATRGDATSLLNGTEHGVILDVWLDDPTNLDWIMSPSAVGGNCDDPDSNVVYLTIDNVGAASTPITVSINFVGEET